MSSAEPTWEQQDTDTAIKFGEWLEKQDKLEYYADIGDYLLVADKHDKENSKVP